MRRVGGRSTSSPVVGLEHLLFDDVIRPASPDDAGALARLQLRVAFAAYADIVDPDLLARQDVEADAVRWRGWLDDGRAPDLGLGPGGGDRRPRRGGRRHGRRRRPRARQRLLPRGGRRRPRARAWAARCCARRLDGLREDGFTEATLWTFTANERAIRFYTAAGWTPDGATVEPDGAGAGGRRRFGCAIDL